MSDSHLKHFTTNGQTTYQGQQNAGVYEANRLSYSTPQALHESYDAYLQRTNAYTHEKKKLASSGS